MAYRADIEIAVRGAQELKRLQDQVSATSKLVDGLNNYLSNIGGGGIVRSIDNLNETVAQTAAAFNKAALGTDEATLAARNFVSANRNLTQGLEERLALLKSITEQERQQRLGAAGIRETSGTTELGPGPASPVGSLVGQKSSVDDIIRRTLQGKQDEIELQAALLRLEEKSATALNEKIELQQRLNRVALEQGKTDVERVSAQQAERQQFLAGKSGTAIQGPLAPAGAMGFPVALSLSKVEQQGIQAANALEQKGIETAAKKQAILQRMVATRQALVGLAGNLQQIERNAANTAAANAVQDKIAIADAVRAVELQKKKAELAAAALKTTQAETKAAVALAQQQQKTLEAKRKERSGMVQNALIGGAFPMLFGGGAGAVLGGAAGGFIPGNPMMSIVTSALGTMVDEFAAAAVAVGAALLDTATTFDFVKEKSLFSSKELEKYATKLQEAGFVASASAVAQSEILNKVGSSGVEGFTALASESDQLNRALADLTIQMQAFIAGPLAVLLNRLGGAVALPAASNRATTLQAELGRQGRGAAAERLGREVQKIEQSPTVQFGLDPQQAADDIKKLTDYYSQFVIKPKVKLTQQQIDKEVIAVLEKRLQTINIAKGLKDQVTAAAREQESVDRQRAELVRSYEESLAAIRLRIEDQISGKRLSVIQKENELLDVQARIRQEGLSLVNMQAQATTGQGLPTAARDVARQAAEAVNSFAEQELSLAEQAAKLKRDAALAALTTDLEATKFKITAEKEVSRLNTETAKKVADINRGVREKNQSIDQNKFKLEQQIAVLQLKTIQAEFALLNQQAAGAGPVAAQIQADTSKAYNALTEIIRNTQNLQAPERIKEVAGVGGGGVSFAGLDAVNEKLTLAQKRIDAAQLALNDLLSLKNVEGFKAKMQSIADSIDAPIETLNEQLQTNEKTRTRYTELIRQGVRGVVAERIIEVERLKEVATLQYDAVIAELEKKLAIEGTNTALEDQIKKYKERRDAIAGGAATAVDNIKKEESPAARIKEEITKVQDELNTLLDPVNMITTAAAGIGNAFSNSFKGIIDGSMTAKEALASFFTSVADMFLDMAAQIIAKMITMAILNAVLGVLPGGNSASALGSNPSVGAYSGTGIEGITMGTFGGARANGGPVSSGQTYMVGERGPELFVPGRSGTIVANDKMGGGSTNVVVNVDAKGSSVEGNEQGANQLGRVISAAVQSELIKQQRPGGLLAR